MNDEVQRDRPVESKTMQREAEKEEGDRENREEASPALIAEVVQFLDPSTRLDVRREALKIVMGLSLPLDGSAERAFAANDFMLGKALCRLCEATVSDRMQTLVALTNFVSISSQVADFLLQRATHIIAIAYQAATSSVDHGEVSARLLANCSRLFPGETHLRLLTVDPNFFPKLVEKLATSRGDQLTTTLGYTVVNMATVSRVRKELLTRDETGKPLLHKLYAVVMQSEDEERRRIAADVFRNCTFDDGVHEELLDESDDFLVALLTPLVDADDALDTEETEKLPLRLQYFEGRRSSDGVLRKKLVEALYQLCATRHGREVLRKRGVYPLMRELDRAKRRETNEEPTAAKLSRNFTSERENPENEEHVVHSVIGVLIRYEEEMGVDPSLHSIRTLE